MSLPPTKPACLFRERGNADYNGDGTGEDITYNISAPFSVQLQHIHRLMPTWMATFFYVMRIAATPRTACAIPRSLIDKLEVITDCGCCSQTHGSALRSTSRQHRL